MAWRSPRSSRPEHADDPQFEYGFLLHDIGKLAIPDAVLAKEGALTEAEWEQIRAHPAAGRNILARIPFLAGASEIVYAHHERWDGSGFPQGLVGDEIPLGARIFPLADAFDAMTTERPYRAAIEHGRCARRASPDVGKPVLARRSRRIPLHSERAAREHQGADLRKLRPLMTSRTPLLRATLAALAVLVAMVAVLGMWQVIAAGNSQRTQIGNGELTAVRLASSAVASAVTSRLATLDNLADLSGSATFVTTNSPRGHLGHRRRAVDALSRVLEHVHRRRHTASSS